MFRKINILFLLLLLFMFSYFDLSYAGEACGAGGCSLTQFFATMAEKQEEEQSEQESAGNPTEKKMMANKVTFIELGSKRCMPCKMMEPILKEIRKEYKGKVNVVFYDVWTEAGKPYAEKYNITSIPTQIFLDKDGKEYFRHVGFFPKKQIVKVLKDGGIE